MRQSDPLCKIDRAVRFLYLNRTAFGGMYRLNQQGRFNVPYGGGQRTAEPLWSNNLLINSSTALRNARIFVGDFEELVTDAGEGDLVYCDPTYTVTHNNNGFVRYNERNFSWHDQTRLARVCKELERRGATVVVSNAFHDDIRRLYTGAEAHVLNRLSLLTPKASKRRMTSEYVFILRPK